MAYQKEPLSPYSSINCSYPNTCTIKLTNEAQQEEILSRIKWRLGTSMPIISTVSYSFLTNEVNNFCCTVEFEKIIGEVFNLGKLTIGEGVYLIKEYVLGAQILILKFGGLGELNPRECFYGINSKGQAKMWLSRDYTDMRKEKKQEDKTKNKEEPMNVSKFVSFLFCKIESKVNANGCETFKEIAKKMMKGEMRNFSEAYQKLKKIICEYEIMIPMCLRKTCFKEESKSKVIGSIEKPRLSLKCQKPSTNPYLLRKMKSINNEGGKLLLRSLKERNLSPAVSPHFRPFKVLNQSEYELSNKRPKTNYVFNKDENLKMESSRHYKFIDSSLSNSIRKKPLNRQYDNYLVSSLKSLKHEKTNSNNKMNNFLQSCSNKKNSNYEQNVIINEFNPLHEEIEEDEISFLNKNDNNFTHPKTVIGLESSYRCQRIKDNKVTLKETEKCDEKSKQIPKFLTSLLHNKNVELKISSEISSSQNQAGAQFFLKIDKKSMTTTQASGMEANFNKDSLTTFQPEKQEKILPKITGENLVVFQIEKEILNSIVIETPVDSFRSFEEDELNNFGKGYDFGGLIQVESKVLQTSSSNESLNHSIEGKSAISLKGSRKSIIQNMKESEEKLKINIDINCGMELMNFLNSKDIKESFFCGDDKKASFLKLKLSRLDKLGREINESYTC